MTDTETMSPQDWGHAPHQDARAAAPIATRAVIAGVGAYLPARIATNDELTQLVDTSDAWIRERTGIRQRHLAAPHETAVLMATEAAAAALAHAGADAADIDAVLVATSTPDEAFPATAVRVQAALGITRGFAFDIAAACSGFIYALATADAFMRSGAARNVLVIGTEVYSRILNWQDRTTCVLFGDGAGAVLLRAGPPDGPGILSTHLHVTCTQMAAWATYFMWMAPSAAPTGPVIWS
ncbi:MAG: beta-ketoacyl-ACP synthase 3 [Rhodospirillales bacterium]